MMTETPEIAPGTPVELALPTFHALRWVRWARYMGPSHTPGKVWLVAWRAPHTGGHAILVDAPIVYVSTRSVEPPAMPVWAMSKEA